MKRGVASGSLFLGLCGKALDAEEKQKEGVPLKISF
jgi:hypothetical protein